MTVIEQGYYSAEPEFGSLHANIPKVVPESPPLQNAPVTDLKFQFMSRVRYIPSSGTGAW